MLQQSAAISGIGGWLGQCVALLLCIFAGSTFYFYLLGRAAGEATVALAGIGLLFAAGNKAEAYRNYDDSSFHCPSFTLLMSQYMLAVL